MANYGIRVPNVVGDFGQGLQTAQSLNYWDDRKRKIAAQEAAQNRQTTMDERELKRQQTKDFGLMAKNLDVNNQQQLKQAGAYLIDKYPSMAPYVVKAMKQGPDGFKNMISMFQEPSQQKRAFEQLTLYGPEGQTKRVAVEKGKDFTPEEGWSLSKATKGMKIYDSTTGNLIVDTGGGEVTKKTAGALESGTMGDYETLHQLEEIKSVYDDKFLTYGGKAKGWFNKIKEKSGFELSENDKEFIGTKKKFDQRVNQFFNSYRKLITGAAASVQELASLKKAVLNTDQSPTEFKAAYDDMVQGYQRSLRINNRLLREGVKRGTKDWGKRFDSLYMSGGDDVADERAIEIKENNPNATDSDIAKMLMSEGFS